VVASSNTTNAPTTTCILTLISNQHGAPVLRAGIHGDPIIIRDHNNVPTQLKQLSVYTPYKTLGTFQCPGSNQHGQANTLIKRSKELTRTLATSNCHGPSAWMFFTSVFHKSVGYPLAVSRLTQKQLLQIQGPMIPLILNRLGYERRLARSLTFGPLRFGGLGIPHLLSSKVSSQISLFLRHLRTPGQPHLLSRINISCLQQTAGISTPVLECPSLRLPHLEGSWLTHFRASLTDPNASIEIANLSIILPQRIHDFYIMEHALTLALSDKDIRLINYCRFYLQATTVSDLCTATGTHLQPNATNGSLPLQCISKLSEPYKEFPCPLAW
jgi:hypothetical protein